MAESSPQILINKLFSIIDTIVAESKETTIRAIDNMDHIDVRARSSLQVQVANHLVTLKVAIEKYKTAIGGIELAVSTLSNGLTPEEALIQLTSKMNINN